MALTKIPAATPIVLDAQPKARDDTFRSAVVDEQYNSQLDLVNYAAGFSVECDYYEQLLGEADEQAPFQLNRDAAEQQYRLVKHYPIKLQSSLTTSFDAENNRFTSEGTIVIPAASKPYFGNMLFITGLDHRTAIYTITRVTPKNISLAPAYECDISFQGILKPDLERAYAEKVVEETIYDQDQLKHGKHPVIATAAYNRKYDYYRSVLGLCEAYYHEFYNRQRQTLLVPGINVQTYDPWAVSAFLKIYQSIEGKKIWGLGRLNVDDDQFANAYSVFEWVMEGKPEMESRMTVEFGLRAVTSFYRFPQAGGIRYSGVHRCVWPKQDSKTTMAIADWVDDEPGVKVNPLYNEAPPLSLDSVPLFPDLFGDRYYVFSENFYRNRSPMSVLEAQVRTLVGEKLLSHTALKLLVERVPYLTPIERYYFTPFILMLLRTGALQP